MFAIEDIFSKQRLCSLEDFFSFYKKNSTRQHGPWIAGGVGRCLANGDRNFNDIDIWFAHQQQFIQFKNRFLAHFDRDVYQIFNTDNAETWQVGDYKVQFIKKKFFNSVEEVLDHFDFTCCQIAVDGDMRISGPGISDAKDYVLKINRLDHEGFLARYSKYLSYGYEMDPDEFISIIETQGLNYDFDGKELDY